MDIAQIQRIKKMLDAAAGTLPSIVWDEETAKWVEVAAKDSST